MPIYAQSILQKYGIENVLTKLKEEIDEYLESRSPDELADVKNVMETVMEFARQVDEETGGMVSQIAYEKRNRTTIRMVADWYDEDGQKQR